MRTGAEYREALRDDRKVWVVGEGLVDDVTTHPATSAMVEEYVAWYDRHFDPAWQETLIAPPAAGRERTAWAYVLPKTSDDLIGMGRSFAKTIFLSAGNMTHTPGYGHLISLGVGPDELVAIYTTRSIDMAGSGPNDVANVGHCEADRRCGGLSRDDRRDRAVSDVLRRRRPDRFPVAP